ncbi:MAG TPA: lytic transglycosylase domain-containing protein [Bryobacteraceae bacterium]|nr:lytic transglycosylase domain-containing protein [Bryobacteraceae bacterium]
MRLAITAALLYVCALGAQPTQLSVLEKQRASVRRQVAAKTPANTFFTTPWAEPPSGSVASPPPWLPAVASGDCDPVPETTLSKLIMEAGHRENLDARIIRAVIQRESGGKPCAVSPKGAQGLMQLMPATQIDLGVNDPFDPQSNIQAGVRYLKQMLERYKGDMALALAAYNAGPQRVEPGGKIPDIPETQAYVMSIMGQLNEEPPAEVK